ncbi:hypothetical protein AX17_003580 [Amanita inopinata Kibby_2008]|nr:hypothetical protein AX17_003580 [Amanita inopinata Kibby_2008]
MENPWADSWNNAENPPQWSQTQGTSSHQEADIGTPSWSTGTEIQWTEPSTFNSLWNADSVDAVPAWTTSTTPYDNIPIGKLSQTDLVEQPETPVSERQDTPSFETAPTTPTSPNPGSAQNSPLESSVPLQEESKSPPTPRPDSPDAFGTFETAEANHASTTSVNSWTSPGPSFVLESLDDSNAWGGAGEPSNAGSSSDEPVDEWEKAKLQKERQDQHVPPEVLTSILKQARELAGELWPESTLDEGEFRQLSKDILVDIPNLKRAVDKFIPDDLVLSASAQFPKTFTSRYMNEALRLTRHLPMTSSSPMSFYMASKGSIAWEASVKARQDIHQDDLLPPGWRMVEKDKQELLPSSVEAKKKTGGGFLSFFSRRNVDTPSESVSHRLTISPSRPTSIMGSIKSPRSSLDGSSKPASESRSSLNLHSPRATTVASPLSNLSALDSSSLAFPEPDTVPSPEATQQLAPSAMSRLFGRFSRTSGTSTTSSTNSIQSRSHSLALSSDDLEFLSDIVPSMNDDADETENLKALTNMVTPKPTSGRLLPPPLPPPPPNPIAFHPRPSTARTQTISQQSSAHGNLLSLFDSPMTEQPLGPAASGSKVLGVPLIPSPVPTAPSIATNTSLMNSSILTIDTISSSTSSLSPSSTTPNSRAHTPAAARLSSPALPQKRGVTAIMSDSSRSTPSSFQTSLPPPPLPPPLLPFSPMRASQTIPSHQPQGKPVSAFDNDDFSDFLSSPVPTTRPPSGRPYSQPIANNTTAKSTTIPGVTSFGTSTSMASFSSTSSGQGLLDSSSFNFGTDGFSKLGGGMSDQHPVEDEFNEFMSMTASALQTSSPPLPPAKPANTTLPVSAGQEQMSIQRKDRESLPPPSPRKQSRTADHSRTLSLLETAAAHPGRWPAPLSPSLPTIVPPPPPPPRATSKDGVDIFDELERKYVQQAQAQGQAKTLDQSRNTSLLKLGTLAPLRAISPPVVPSKVNGMDISGIGIGARSSNPSWSLNANGGKPVAPANKKTTGGLTPQDLSFFEGL